MSEDAAMQFEGFLDRWSFQGTALELRFSSGSLEPSQSKDEVLYVTIEHPADKEALQERLCEVQPFETELYVEEVSPTEIRVQFYYGAPLVLRGTKVVLRQSEFQGEDYARLARHHYEWGTSTNDSLIAVTRRIDEAKHLLEEQVRRISEKRKRHEIGSTAHTLYEQQLSFISRVLAKLDT